MSKTIVIGGGYAGLACLSELSKTSSSMELFLIDARSHHVKLTQLHKTLRHPLEQQQVSYARLADRFKFRFYQQPLDLSPEQLQSWLRKGSVDLTETSLPFDHLVVSSGATPLSLPEGPETLSLDDLLQGRGPAAIENLAAQAREEPLPVSLVGGGATGIQVLFELEDILQDLKIPYQLRLIDLGERLVPGLPRGIHRAIQGKLKRRGIDYLPGTRYLRQKDQRIELLEVNTGTAYSLSSALTLLFPGVQGSPQRFEANRHGQVLLDGECLEALFTCGDCSSYHSSGLNSMTAQAALRKGKLVAKNIINRERGRSLQSYRYSEKGYIISLGRRDAAGWLGLQFHRISGPPAAVLKESMEFQYDLFLSGVDTFVDFW